MHAAALKKRLGDCRWRIGRHMMAASDDAMPACGDAATAAVAKGDHLMNHFAEPAALRLLRNPARRGGRAAAPLAVAVATLERCLAEAHEDGDAASVRRLHAALSVLTGGVAGVRD